jgi:hypothetical protein
MRRPTILAVIASVLTCAVLSNATQAGDVYKYVDEKGNTLYTDRPMPGAVRISSSAVRPPDVAARSYAAQQSSNNQQLASSNQKISQQQADQKLAATVNKDAATSQADLCKKARKNYDLSLASRRVYTEDKNGNRTYMSDAEITQQRMEAKKTVDAICGPNG